MAENPLLEFVTRYRDDAELFVREVFGFPNALERQQGKDIYPWQSEALRAYDLQSPRISIRSGHGVGKTTLLAWIAWHRILFRFPQKTGITAPSEKQLFDALWAEFEAWGNRLPKTVRSLVDVKADSAVLMGAPAESFISIKTARAEQPDALQGLHSEWELLLIDEPSGVSDAVWDAAQSSLTGPHPMVVLGGNPLRREGFFFETHDRLAAHWWTRRVSREEIADLERDSYTQSIVAAYTTSSNQYRVRILGEFPISEDDVLIPFDLVEPALTRDITEHRTVPVTWGLDCARFGSNRSALAKRQGRILIEPIRWWAKLDTMEIAGRVKVEWDTTPQNLRPVLICVDSIGVGGGVVDRLKQLGLPARGINVSESPALGNLDRYSDLRTELWFRAREWFARRDCKIPESYKHPKEGADFIGELTREKYDFHPRSGKTHVLPKNQVHSPDLADAFILTFAADAVAIARGKERTGEAWKPQPIRGLV